MYIEIISGKLHNHEGLKWGFSIKRCVGSLKEDECSVEGSTTPPMYMGSGRSGFCIHFLIWECIIIYKDFYFKSKEEFDQHVSKIISKKFL